MSDIFKFFDRMNAGDLDYVDNISDEEVKGLSPFVISMWLSGAKQNNVEHVLLTDNHCNDYIFSLGKHPRLLLKIFMATNHGISTRGYKFEKCIGARETNQLKSICRAYQCGIEEARSYLKLLDKDDLKFIEEVYGE